MPYSARILLTILIALGALPTQAEEVFPGPDWKDSPNPLASPDAVVGGTITLSGSSYPQSFNYYLDNNVFSADLFDALYDSLLRKNPVTLDDIPHLAEKWSISDDKMTFTFWMNKKATWSDGKSITAHDVQFTYDVIMDKKNLTGPHKVSMERFERPTVVNDHQIVFKVKEGKKHWRNLLTLGAFNILPKHAMGDKKFMDIHFELPVVSGPYKLGKVKEGSFAEMDRREDWWARGYKRYRNTGNFETIRYRFFTDSKNALDSFLAGDLDLHKVGTAKYWVKETTGERFDKNWVVKQRIYNHRPLGFGGWAMNTRKPPFDDIRVRQAMSHLIDRERMNKEFMYSQYNMTRAVFEDLYSEDNPCTHPYFEFNPEKARKLLTNAGWKANPETGILEKDGTPFHFKFLSSDSSSHTMTFLNRFMEDLKDVGVKMSIDQKDWAAWLKDMDEFNFEMTWSSWRTSVYKDPEGMWHSREAKRLASNNITGFSNDKVDALIEKQRDIYNLSKRNEVLREIDAILTEHVAFALLWNLNYTRMLYWNKFGTPDTVLDKYSADEAAVSYWWFDEDQEADLEHAMDKGTALPRKPSAVYFDKAYRR